MTNRKDVWAHDDLRGFSPPRQERQPALGSRNLTVFDTLAEQEVRKGIPMLMPCCSVYSTWDPTTGIMPSTFKEAFSSSGHPFWKSPLTTHKEVSLIHAGGNSSLDRVDS